MNKSHWVPRLLKVDGKAKLVETSGAFVACYYEGDSIFDCFITMDETRLYLYEPGSRQHAMV